MPSVFHSIHHPGDTPRGLVYARRLARPVGACTLPVMIGAAVTALQGDVIWGYLVWGLPTALAVATTWTQFTLSTTPAELHLRAGQCAMQSVHDILYDRSLQWHPLYGVEAAAGSVKLSIGWTTEVCRRTEWPDFSGLRDAVQHAHRPPQEAGRPVPGGS